MSSPRGLFEGGIGDIGTALPTERERCRDCEASSSEVGIGEDALEGRGDDPRLNGRRVVGSSGRGKRKVMGLK